VLDVILLLLALGVTAPAGAAEPVAPIAAVVLPAHQLTRYDTVRAALVADDLGAATAAARALGEAPGADPGLARAAGALAAAPDLAAARMAFGDLSRVVITALVAAPSGPKVFVYHCPMFAGFAWWIQLEPGIANPYMGRAMPACGEERSLKAAARAAAVP
jgi:hypothetical protein